MLPLVDECVVNVGDSDDKTLRVVQELAQTNPKIKIIESVWQQEHFVGGKILAEQTNIALQACQGKWGIYLQADEVLHEQDYDRIRTNIAEADRNSNVDGVLFDYLHFYGSYSVVNFNPSQYRHEIRAIRLHSGVVSHGDAQGFRKQTTDDSLEKLRAIPSGATVYHYGWVRPQQVMRQKTIAMDQLYHADGQGTGDNSRYKHIYGLERFKGAHPKIMRDTIAAAGWQVDVLGQPMVFHWKDIRKVLGRWCEKLTGWLPFAYRNYRLFKGAK